MTPGLAFFYGGLARKTQCFIYHDAIIYFNGNRYTDLDLRCGFGLAFGKDEGELSDEFLITLLWLMLD